MFHNGLGSTLHQVVSLTSICQRFSMLFSRRQKLIFCCLAAVLLCYGFLYFTVSERDERTSISSLTIANAPSRQRPAPFNVIGRAHDNLLMIAYIKSHLHAPSNSPYDLGDESREDFSQFNQTAGLKKLYQTKKNGFFLEVRAYDGETFSNTLYWERQRNWTGLLIEPNPDKFVALLTKHRKAHALRACLSPTNFAEVTRFDNFDSGKETTDVPCYPLYSILAAVGFPKIDFLSLDIGGLELEILKTIPFEAADIRVIMVKYNHIKKAFGALQTFLVGKGYKLKEKNVLFAIFTKKGIKLI